MPRICQIKFLKPANEKVSEQAVPLGSGVWKPRILKALRPELLPQLSDAPH
jgi:hypothetical protein